MMLSSDLKQRFAMVAVPLFVLVIGCSPADSQQEKPTTPSEQFAEYWYQGKAEVSRYRLTQARYGELRQGDAVLIFVTEDFLGDEQVKLESDPTGKNVVPIMKLNMAKKFLTGIYPYSLMTSVFTPRDISAHPRTLKITTSAQEWCGHVFTQFNLRGSLYEVMLRSYFEKEGDRDYSIDAAMPEDEIWNRIRLAPESLPTGSVSMIPGTMWSRLAHTDMKPVQAEASRQDLPGDSLGNNLVRYTVMYAQPYRELAIDYRKEFPHEIVRWTETYDDFGKRLVTTAVRTHSMMIDYWSRHDNDDLYLRDELGLPGGKEEKSGEEPTDTVKSESGKAGR